jgi:hypothetical protein
MGIINRDHRFNDYHFYLLQVNNPDNITTWKKKLSEKTCETYLSSLFFQHSLRCGYIANLQRSEFLGNRET